jgi:GT2 family glycosyltransferase
MRPEVEAARAEVWVVDNASSDGSADMVRAEFDWAHLVEPGRNIGFGPAVNLVAERTDGEWIAVANADVELTPGALETLLAAGRPEGDAAPPGADRPKAGSRVGAVAPRLELPDDSTQHSVYAFPTLPFAAAFALGLHRLGGLGDRLCVQGRWDPTRARRVDWAVGAFLLVRRRAWDEAGGFDPAQWMYAEDLDLGWRLARAGWATRYEPAASVLHAESAATGQAWGDARTERWLRSTYEWMRRRRGPARTRAYALLNVAGAAARHGALAPAAALRPGRFAAPRDEMRRWTALHRRIGLAREPGGGAAQPRSPE